MNLYRHGMIFGTFFGSCLCIGLLAAALGTRYWIVSNAVRPNYSKSGGRIFIGLFEGEKNLNFGFGLRCETIEVPALMSEMMIYPLWLGTVICMCAGILFSAAAAVFAVINTATTPIGILTGVPGLYIWNTLSVLFQLGAIILWALQYHKKLRFNVMNEYERSHEWTSNGMAFFGLSYWLVVASVLLQFINIILIYSGTSDIREKKKATKPVIEEKANGAIMLY
uniref:Putative conserved plasma membrane protein n=1 Tax=Panstrongylus lignarius TaxID=156445 RepID=A0A224XVX5_9HEMI